MLSLHPLFLGIKLTFLCCIQFTACCYYFVWSCPIKIIPTAVNAFMLGFVSCLLNPLDPMQNAWYGLKSLTRLIWQPHSYGNILADGGDAQTWHRSCCDMFMLLGRDIPHWWVMKTCSHREKWPAWRQYVMVKFQMKHREKNDWGLSGISKGGRISTLRNYNKIIYWR